MNKAGELRKGLAVIAKVLEKQKEAIADVLKPIVSLMQDIDTIRSYMLKWTKEDMEVTRIATSLQQGGAYGTDEV